MQLSGAVVRVGAHMHACAAADASTGIWIPRSGPPSTPPNAASHLQIKGLLPWQRRHGGGIEEAVPGEVSPNHSPAHRQAGGEVAIGCRSGFGNARRGCCGGQTPGPNSHCPQAPHAGHRSMRPATHSMRLVRRTTAPSESLASQLSSSANSAVTFFSTNSGTAWGALGRADRGWQPLRGCATLDRGKARPHLPRCSHAEARPSPRGRR